MGEDTGAGNRAGGGPSAGCVAWGDGVGVASAAGVGSFAGLLPGLCIGRGGAIAVERGSEAGRLWRVVGGGDDGVGVAAICVAGGELGRDGGAAGGLERGVAVNAFGAGGAGGGGDGANMDGAAGWRLARDVVSMVAVGGAIGEDPGDAVHDAARGVGAISGGGVAGLSAGFQSAAVGEGQWVGADCVPGAGVWGGVGRSCAGGGSAGAVAGVVSPGRDRTATGLETLPAVDGGVPGVSWGENSSVSRRNVGGRAPITRA